MRVMDLKRFIGMQIKEMRLARGMDQEQLGKKLNTTKQSISRYENGERQANQDILFNLAKIFNVSIDYFFPQRRDENNDLIKEPTTLYKYFPGTISAGIPVNIDGVTYAEHIEIPKALMGKWADDKDLFIMKVNGESMNKVIPHGSLIAVKPIEYWDLKNGDIVVYSTGGDYSVKRYYKDDALRIFKPDSTDPAFYDHVIPTYDEELEIHGKVVIYIVELD